MIHMNVIKIPGLKKVAVIIMVLVVAFICFLPFRESVHALSTVESGAAEDDIYKIIMKKTLPLLDAESEDSNDNDASQFIAYTLFKYVTKIDFANPRTYLASEIPLLDLFDIALFNGSVAGASSSENVIKEENPAVDKSNYDDEPVVNPNINPEKPEVIIFHTHTSESYTATAKNNYEMTGDYNTTNNNFNVCRTGDEIKKYIESYYGISVLHDTTVHDIPYRSGSYNKSRVTIENLLKKYPDVKLIIDLHRDAVWDGDQATRDEARKNMVTEIRGEQAAKIMFVIGKANPHWQENYYLSSKLNQKAEELYPGLTRKMYITNNILYNQDVSNKAVIIELGAEVNTLEEVLISAKMVGRTIGQILKEN